MPALNVEFSERKLEGLRQIAKERGTSMKALMREAAAADTARHRALQEGAEAFRSFFASHADEFAEAFSDDEAPVRGEGRVLVVSLPSTLAAPTAASGDIRFAYGLHEQDRLLRWAYWTACGRLLWLCSTPAGASSSDGQRDE